MHGKKRGRDGEGREGEREGKREEGCKEEKRVGGKDKDGDRELSV